MAVTSLVVDPNLASCPEGMCPGKTCTRPICSRPRRGDCPSGQAGPCLMPWEYPLQPFKFNLLMGAWRQTAQFEESQRMEQLVSQLVSEELGEPIEEPEALQPMKAGEDLERQAAPYVREALREDVGWQPDGRFFLGLGMASVGGYLLWRFRKNRR